MIINEELLATERRISPAHLTHEQRILMVLEQIRDGQEALLTELRSQHPMAPMASFEPVALKEVLESAPGKMFVAKPRAKK